LLLLVTGVALLLPLLLPPRRVFLDADGPHIHAHLAQDAALARTELDLVFPRPRRLRMGRRGQQQQRQGEGRFH
jgi:hypothetical protein